MKLHILVTDDKRKQKSKGKKPMKATKNPAPAKSDKRKAQQAYWARRKAQEKKQAQANAPAGGNNEQEKK